MLGTLWAICEPAEDGRLTGTVGPPLIAIGWAALVFWLIKSSPSRDRWPVVAVLVVCLGLGVIVYLVPGDPQGDLNYLDRTEISMLAAAVLGLLASIPRWSASPPRMLSAALLGIVAAPGLYILAWIFSLAVNNGCID